MNVLITGGTGFVGNRLAEKMLDNGWNVTITGRSRSGFEGRERFEHIVCDTTVEGPWQERVACSDVIVNLAGRNIFTLWNEQKKKDIRDSRLLTTRNIVNALPSRSNTVLLSTSASGYYGDGGETLLNEESPLGSGFLADLCKDWENEAMKAERKGVRVVCMRFSMILGKNGGALEKMITPFRLCLGGNLGNGEQWMAWMHLDDLVAAVLFLIDHQEVRGPVNFCSPFPVRNNEFTKTLSSILGRPAFFHIPSFVLKTILGELGDVMLGSQRMASKNLEEAGFSFNYPDIAKALDNLVS
jgi:uncharacterized protein (TIGR01777 family)